jgi:hypothetical protein
MPAAWLWIDWPGTANKISLKSVSLLQQLSGFMGNFDTLQLSAK